MHPSRSLPPSLTNSRCPPAGLQSEPGRVAELRQFIEHALQQPDVWFVTNQQVIGVGQRGWWHSCWRPGGRQHRRGQQVGRQAGTGTG